MYWQQNIRHTDYIMGVLKYSWGKIGHSTNLCLCKCCVFHLKRKRSWNQHYEVESNRFWSSSDYMKVFKLCRERIYNTVSYLPNDPLTTKFTIEIFVANLIFTSKVNYIFKETHYHINGEPLIQEPNKRLWVTCLPPVWVRNLGAEACTTWMWINATPPTLSIHITTSNSKNAARIAPWKRT